MKEKSVNKSIEIGPKIKFAENTYTFPVKINTELSFLELNIIFLGSGTIQRIV